MSSKIGPRLEPYRHPTIPSPPTPPTTPPKSDTSNIKHKARLKKKQI